MSFLFSSKVNYFEFLEGKEDLIFISIYEDIIDISTKELDVYIKGVRDSI